MLPLGVHDPPNEGYFNPADDIITLRINGPGVGTYRSRASSFSFTRGNCPMSVWGRNSAEEYWSKNA